MSAPTTPAPMSAERLNEIRAVHQSDWARELYIHIDALTVRIAELELALGEERSLTVDQIALCADLDAAVERALAAEAALKEAEQRADAETDLRQGVEEAADELTEAWKRRAITAEAKLETARRDALEEAALASETVSHAPNYTPPEPPSAHYSLGFNMGRHAAAEAIRAYAASIIAQGATLGHTQHDR